MANWIAACKYGTLYREGSTSTEFEIGEVNSGKDGGYKEPKKIRILGIVTVPNTEEGVQIVLLSRRLTKDESARYKVKHCSFKSRCSNYARRKGTRTRSFVCCACAKYKKCEKKSH